MNELRCIVIDDERYSIDRLEELIAITPGIIHDKSFENAYDAMRYLHQAQHIDLIFSDIGMPFINGIEAAKLLKPYCSYLVFITGHREYGEESFEVGADGYLMKPLQKLKFTQQIQKLIEKKKSVSATKQHDNFVLVKGGLKNNYLSLQYEKIMYIKAMSNYIQVFSKDSVNTSYHTLTDMETTLKERSEFLRINRSEIISFNHVRQLDGYQIVLTGGQKFTVSRSYRNKFETYVRNRLPGGWAS
ncbi:LytTR family DNA-binding domain-containing protein [Pedobacter aquatilis]|uniref:LytR/AlgR family response regulator transcription factor n=1 Tax=Pedobacter aquatilis TaxID=351343 RepID=UPI0025B51713|nr:LytTR family DNA-binding domain-containing protein [Pedobacter aquatilis]MDN3588050.1 LytTR family DNA-binding domain-containing protein [Pedobacter aquatilis]